MSVNYNGGGEHSFGIDIIATAFILPFIVTLIVIPLQRKKLRAQKVSPIVLNHEKFVQRYISYLPKSLFLTALIFGAISMLIFSPATFLGFQLLGIETVSPLNYSIFKGMWAGLIAAAMVGPMILFALKAQATQQNPNQDSQTNMSKTT